MWNFSRAKWKKLKNKNWIGDQGYTVSDERWRNNSAADEWQCAGTAVSMNYMVKVSQPTIRSYINERGQTNVNEERDWLLCLFSLLSIFDAQHTFLPQTMSDTLTCAARRTNTIFFTFAFSSVESYTSKLKCFVIERDSRCMVLSISCLKSACSI